MKSIEYYWYLYAKPVLMLVLAVVFSGLSLIILYAEMTTVFDYKNNIIYNIMQASSVGPSSAFLVENVKSIRI